MEANPQYYRIDVSKLSFREEVSLLPHGVKGYFSRRFGAGRSTPAAGGRFPTLILREPVELRMEQRLAPSALQKEKAPADTRRASLERSVSKTMGLGFKSPVGFAIGHALSTTSQRIILMRHASGNAIVRLYDPDRADGAISATFITPLDDRGAALSSTEHRATTLLPPSIAPFCHPGLRLETLWEEHKRHVAELPHVSPAPLGSDEELLSFYNTMERSIFAWRNNGRDLLIPLTDAEGTLLAQRAHAAQREQKRLRRGGLASLLTFASLQCAFAPPTPSGELSPDGPLTPALIAATPPQGVQAGSRIPSRPLCKGGWLDALAAAGATLLLFGAAHHAAWHDTTLHLSLLAAILLHGVGHALGWRALHCREAARHNEAIAQEARRARLSHLAHTPLYQQVSDRKKPLDPAWRRAAAILLGPLPGICFGAAILTAAVYHPIPAALIQFGGVLLCLNGLTLLPLPFLDGGRLLRLLIFTHFPWLEPLTRALIACALAAGALAFQSLLLATVALLIVATLPHHCRMAAVGRRALRYFKKAERRASPATDQTPPAPPNLTAPIVAVVKRVKMRLPHLVAPEQIATVAHRLCEAAMMRPRSWRVAPVFLALYAGALLLPILPATCYLFESRQMAELALIGGAYQRPRDPIAPTALGVPVYVGLNDANAIKPSQTGGPPRMEEGRNAKATASTLDSPTPTAQSTPTERPWAQGSFSWWY